MVNNARLTPCCAPWASDSVALGPGSEVAIKAVPRKINQVRIDITVAVLRGVPIATRAKPVCGETQGLREDMGYGGQQRPQRFDVQRQPVAPPVQDLLLAMRLVTAAQDQCRVRQPAVPANARGVLFVLLDAAHH